MCIRDRSQGIEKAKRELFSYNIDVEQIYFDQYDSNSFDELIPKIETADCQGVIIATLFKQSVLTLTQRLDQKGIPYISVSYTHLDVYKRQEVNNTFASSTRRTAACISTLLANPSSINACNFGSRKTSFQGRFPIFVAVSYTHLSHTQIPEGPLS